MTVGQDLEKFRFYVPRSVSRKGVANIFHTRAHIFVPYILPLTCTLLRFMAVLLTVFVVRLALQHGNAFAKRSGFLLKISDVSSEGHDKFR